MQELVDNLDQGALRRTFGRFPSGVAAVCATVDGMPQGMAVSSFTSVSLEPPLVSVCIAATSGTWAVLRCAEHLGLTFLSESHDAACRQLAQKTADRFSGISWHEDQDGAVYIDEGAAWLKCTLQQEVPAGDHLIVLLRIQALGLEPMMKPLVFHDSAFCQLA